MQSRREFIASIAACTPTLLAGSLSLSTSAAADDSGGNVSSNEDLMREHGVLRRSLLVYSLSAARLRKVPGSVRPDAIRRTALLFRQFGEDYHERKLEEPFIFPAIKKKRANLSGLVDVLLAQHQRGRELTDYILAESSARTFPSSGEFPAAIDAFVLMYQQHTAREDTVIFPAWHSAIGENQYRAMGERFEEIERKEFGGDGFEQAVKQIADIEQQLGLFDLDAIYRSAAAQGQNPVNADPPSRRSAWRFVLLVGIANLFADMTYEGARGVSGDFLGKLGANGTIVGIVAGGGELAGYLVRSLSGLVADRTGLYWLEVWVGYVINLACVPALALAGAWPVAAGLIVGERVGRGIRRPAMSSILSRAGRELGSGRIFGVNEALDQIGGAVGPLIVALVLARTNSFHAGFAVLLFPAIVTLAMLGAANLATQETPQRKPPKDAVHFKRSFWTYALGGALFAAGYADFALVAYHLGQVKIASPTLISVFYSIAMIAAAATAPLMGIILDRLGMVALGVAIVLSAIATPLAFLGDTMTAGIGVALWGIGTIVQDSLLVALVAKVTSEETRSTAYGIFDTIFGIAWLAGSATLGILYDHFLPGLVVFSIAAQLASAIVFLTGARTWPLRETGNS